MIKINRVLAATDFSECSAHALRYACEMAEVFGADLHLLSVIETPAGAYPEFGISVHDVESGLIRTAEKSMSDLPQHKWEGKLAVSRSVVRGVPFIEIVRYAREHDIDLIVMGTHGRGPITHMLMGSTAEKVVRKAPCPVLTVRPEVHEFVLP